MEWLHAQAAGQILTYHGDDRFELSAEAAMVLARPDAAMFATGAFASLRPPTVVDGLAAAFRTGIGLTYDQLGNESAHQVEAMLGPMARALLVPVIIPALEGVADKLARGARVADVGCGGGLALELLADAFPASRFEGFDPSERAIDLARQKLAGRDNVALFNLAGEELPDDRGYDLVLTFDCIHDMPYPDRTIRESERGSRRTAHGWSRTSSRRLRSRTTSAIRCWR